MAAGTTDYAIEPSGSSWGQERKDKQCEWPGCTKIIKRRSTHCVQHAQITRRIEHSEMIAERTEPQYLEQTPPGMVLLCYPRQALGSPGDVRLVFRRAWRRYWRRKGRAVNPLVAAAWKDLTQ